MEHSLRTRIVGLAAVASALTSACFLNDLFSPKSVANLTVELVGDSLLVVGDTVQLNPQALVDGAPYAGVRFTFTSTRPSVATVDTVGRVAALARDTFRIQVTAHSGSLPGEPPTGDAVFRGIVARVVANADSAIFASLGATRQLEAVGQRKQGDSIPGVRFSWRSDSAQVAPVDSTGRVTAVKNGGLVNVIVTADGRADTVKVRVRQRTRTLIITPASATISGVNLTAQFIADARDSLGTVNTVSPVSWTSTATQVVNVTSAGLATATGEGIAGVVARSDSAADTARVVVSRPLQALIVTPEQTTVQALGDRVQIVARGVDQAGDTVAVPAIQWRSLDLSVATVDTAGAATAVANGTARIAGAAGGREDTARVTVSQVLASVRIFSPSQDTTLTSLQDSARFRADGRDSNGFAIPGAGPFTWSSDDTSVATVNSDGMVIAKQNGTTTIKANTSGVSGSRAVRVQQVIRTVDVTPNRVVMLQYSSVQLAAGGFDARGFTVQGAGFNWTSRKTSVASVNTSGLVSTTGVNDSTYVVATSSNAISDSSLLRVGPISIVCVGGTGQNGRTISKSETWTRAGSPHCVSGWITVAEGATLTIEAGATVKFAADAALQLGICCDAGRSGQLRAVGTPAAPITFTVLSNSGLRGQWSGFPIQWIDQNDSVVIRNAVIEYAGTHGGGNQGRPTISLDNTCRGTVVLDAVTIREGTGDAVNLQGGFGSCKLATTASVIEKHTVRGVVSGRGTVSITGSTIRNNGSDGVVATAGGPATVRDNLIADNTGVGLRVDTAVAISGNRIRGNGAPVQVGYRSLGPLLVGQKMDSLVGNTRDTLLIECCASVDISSADTVRTIARLPWRVNDMRVHLVNGTVWKLEPGATVQSVGGNTHFLIDDGVVLAEGTDTDPVRFLGSEASRCSWGGFVLTDGPDTTRLTNVEFRSGGSGRSGTLNAGDGLIVLNGVRVFQSCGEGIWVGTPRFFAVRGPIVADSNGSNGLDLSAPGITIADSRFVGNSWTGVAAQSSASGFRLVRSEVRGNKSWGVEISASNATVDTSVISGNTSGGFYINRGAPRVRGNSVTTNSGPGIELGGTTGAVIANNLIADNTGLGLGVASPASIAGNRIRGNSLPLSIDVPALGKLAGQPVDSLLGNRRDTLFIDRGRGSVSATDTIRTTAKLPWLIANLCCDVTFTGGTVWKLEPGASVVMRGGSGSDPVISIDDGVVLAEGTSAAPIVFTSLDQTPGSWRGFQLNDGPDTSRFRNVEFRYAGLQGYGFAVNGGLAVLDGVTAVKSSSAGITIGTPSLLVVRGPIVADSNGGVGMSVSYSGITLTGSRFVGNGSHGLSGPALTLRNSTIQGNGGDGVTLGGNGSSTIENNLIADNADVGLRFNMNNGGRIAGNRIRGNRTPVRINSGSLAALVPQNIDSLLGNTRDTLFIDCCGGYNVSSADTVRTTAKLPWRVNDNLSFLSGTVWKIEPGARILVDQRNLYLYGSLIADGGAQGILIRGRADSPGSWGTLQFNGSSDTSVLHNVELRNGGGQGYDGSLLIEGGVSQTVTLDSVRVVRSASGGIRWNGPVAVRRYLAADSNGTYGLRDYRGNVSIPAGSFSANGDWGIELYGGGTSVANAQINDNGASGAEGGVAIYCCGNRTITDSRIAGNSSRGIYVDPNPGGNLTMRRLTIESNSSYGVELRNGTVWFTGNTVRNNGGGGVFSAGSARFFNEFSGNTITGNSGFPVTLDGASLGVFAAQSQATLLGNTKDTLCICSGPADVTFDDGSPTVNASLPWKNQVRLTVGGDRTLTLNPGATIVMDAGAELFIGRSDNSQRGRMLALGTSANPIRIVGRDTTAGFWNQFVFGSLTGDSSVLRHVEIAHGGGAGVQQMLYLGSASGLKIRLDTVTVRKSATNGVWIAGNAAVQIAGLRAVDNAQSGIRLQGGTFTIEGSRFANNGEAGVRVDGGSGHSVTGSILSGNVQWGLLNYTGSNVTATGNWWGSASGPSGQGPGSGDAVSVNVDFSGWLIAVPLIP